MMNQSGRDLVPQGAFDVAEQRRKTNAHLVPAADREVLKKRGVHAIPRVEVGIAVCTLPRPVHEVPSGRKSVTLVYLPQSAGARQARAAGENGSSREERQASSGA